MPGVSPAEAYLAVLEAEESSVGDGDTVGIAGQILQHMFGAAKGRLGVDHPRCRNGTVFLFARARGEVIASPIGSLLGDIELVQHRTKLRYLRIPTQWIEWSQLAGEVQTERELPSVHSHERQDIAVVFDPRQGKLHDITQVFVSGKPVSQWLLCMEVMTARAYTCTLTVSRTSTEMVGLFDQIQAMISKDPVISVFEIPLKDEPE